MMKIKLDQKKILGLVTASLSAFVAFKGAVDEQKKDQIMKDLVERVTKLEGKK